MCFPSYLGIGCACGGGGGVSQMIGTQLANAVFHHGQLKNLMFRNFFFFDNMTTQNDNPRYVKHILGSIYGFFILFGYSVRACVWRGSPKGSVRNC